MLRTAISLPSVAASEIVHRGFLLLLDDWGLPAAREVTFVFPALNRNLLEVNAVTSSQIISGV